MNSLYTLGVRQTSSIQADLERLRGGDTSASLLGQISASLAAMSRTIDDYDSMARREMIKAKQEKAASRVQKFRSDYADFRKEFERVKSDQAAAQRADLFSSSTSVPLTPGAADTRRRFASSSVPSPFDPPENSDNPFRPNPTPAYMAASREDHALHEHTFLQNADARLDDFLAQGREVLDNLVDQRNMLKGTQRRLLSAANTLGLSRDVIGWIERRSTQDMYIFIIGAIFTFLCFFLIWKYLG
ncbi:V-snare-domain-containing protein [Auriscalpium vulgare]|uniref:V-snare-domain-containing protein n=1 Tax=Auriscalpium vulgare TaxID=40419 RepID=A0ACB8R9P5_9AGAM|nr:V-snare-domain-containing protein [Auriscalpium vulgare]